MLLGVSKFADTTLYTWPVSIALLLHTGLGFWNLGNAHASPPGHFQERTALLVPMTQQEE